jgi:hypothetical protein
MLVVGMYLRVDLWRWRQHVFPKRRYLSAGPRGVTAQNNAAILAVSLSHKLRLGMIVCLQAHSNYTADAFTSRNFCAAWGERERESARSNAFRVRIIP